MNKKIIIMSHCILNNNSKVRYINDEKRLEQNKEKQKFIKKIIDKDIGIIQLPCPEFTCYGSNRWGHVKDQFDTPHFRKHCRDLFKLCLEQIEEYINNGYEIKAIIGIEGSPTCGVTKTCRGNWKGELYGNKTLSSTINSIKECKEQGIFIEEINKMLKEKNISIKIVGLDESNVEKILI